MAVARRIVGVVLILASILIVLFTSWWQVILTEDGLPAVLTLVVLLLLLSVLFFAEELIYVIPAMRDFRRCRDQWGDMLLSPSRFYPPKVLRDLVYLRIEEVAEPSSVSEMQAKNLRVGNIVTVLSLPAQPLRRLIRELRYYCSSFFVLLVLGVLSHLNETTSQGVYSVLFSGEALPVVEAIAIMVLVIRISAEIGWITSLIEEGINRDTSMRAHVSYLVKQHSLLFERRSFEASGFRSISWISQNSNLSASST